MTVAYMNQERKQKVAAAVKPILAKYGMKGSLRTDRHSITLTLQSGSLDFVKDMNRERAHIAQSGIEQGQPYYLQVNQYWLDEHYTGTSLAFLQEINRAMQAADWYDRSDAMTDFFDCGYYYHIHVGRWDKPYSVQGA
jgi:hypothetical protein